MIEVIGGCYHETCLAPPVHQFYGSGGRAAAMLSAAGHKVRLNTFVAPETKNHIRRLAALANFEVAEYQSSSQIGFAYVNPLFVPAMHPNIQCVESLSLESENPVLVFGMVEGRSKVNGRTVVFDPQGAKNFAGFRASGSECDRLTIICNERELDNWVPGEMDSSARRLLHEEIAEAVVIKRGAKGVRVYTKETELSLPAFRTQYDGVFSIGSGDAFAASYASQWAIGEQTPVEAALLASQYVAWYVSTRLQSPPSREQIALMTKADFKPGCVYLAGPFFNMTQRWLIEQTRAIFLDMGLEVFSPLHEVGISHSSNISSKDIDGLKMCDRLFAIFDGHDPGTMFEIGYACNLDMPCYLYAEIDNDRNSTMFSGSGCRIIDDYCTAVYNTGWRA